MAGVKDYESSRSIHDLAQQVSSMAEVVRIEGTAGQQVLLAAALILEQRAAAWLPEGETAVAKIIRASIDGLQFKTRKPLDDIKTEYELLNAEEALKCKHGYRLRKCAECSEVLAEKKVALLERVMEMLP